MATWLSLETGLQHLSLVKGIVHISGLPAISNVLYVEGLNSNLLSISQICDADYKISFVQKRFTVYDSSSGVVLNGVMIF